MGIASLIMGCLSLVTCCFCCIGIVFAVLGIVFAMISKGEGPMRGEAKAGFITSLVGLSLNVIMIILYIVSAMIEYM